VRELEQFLPRVAPQQVEAYSGVDHFFSLLKAVHTEQRGQHGESHAALVAHFSS